jgi:hypothetical protein
MESPRTDESAKAGLVNEAVGLTPQLSKMTTAGTP